MAKASEIARRKVTKADSTKWLAAVVGFVMAMLAVMLVTFFVNGGIGFFYHLRIALAVAVLPVAVTFYAMRANSAEFMTTWLAGLLVALVLWVTAIAWVKRGHAIVAMQRDLAQTAEQSDRRIVALDNGRSPGPAPAIAPPSNGNPMLAARHEMKQYHRRQVDDWAKYRAAVPADAWKTLVGESDGYRPLGRDEIDAWFKSGISAINAWGAGETTRLHALRGAFATASLPKDVRTYLLLKLDALEYERKQRVYAEKLVLYRARDVARVLQAHRWRRERGGIVFMDRRGDEAYREADHRLHVGLIYRNAVGPRISDDRAPASHAGNDVSR